MALFELKWLRKLVRRHTHPMPEIRARIWKQRLSIVYALAAWNAFGFVLYMVFSGKADWAKHYGVSSETDDTPAQQWTKTLGIKKAQVYRVSGFNVSSYEINNETDDEANKSA